MNDGTSRASKRWRIGLLAVVFAIGLGILAAAAIAQVDNNSSNSGASITAEATTAQAEVTTSEQVTSEAVPVGGTAAGAGGTAQDGRSVVPILLGITGLGLAVLAAGLARRRRFD